MMKHGALWGLIGAVLGTPACGKYERDDSPGAEQPADDGQPGAGTAGSNAHGGNGGGGNAGGGVGGSAGAADPPSCNVSSEPCGGDIVGTWSVADCPLALTGPVDVTGLGLGCSFGTTISGSLTVSGTWTADAAGAIRDDTFTQGAHVFALAPACSQVGTVTGCSSITRGFRFADGYAHVDCTGDPEIPDGCICSGTFNQQGGLAVISADPLRTGTYSQEGSRINTIDRGLNMAYDHCVDGDVLILTVPEPARVGQVVGPIVLGRQ